MTAPSRYTVLQASSLSLYRAFLRVLRTKPAANRAALRHCIRADFEACHATIPRTAIAAAEYKLRIGRRKLEMLQSSNVTGMQSIRPAPGPSPTATSSSPPPPPPTASSSSG